MGDRFFTTKHKRRWIVLIILCLLLIALAAELLRSKYALTCSYYSVTTDKVESSIRIVQITDLHNSVFGSENERLVKLVREQEPDLILITGDLVDSGDDETDIATGLIARLVQICPVYVSMGNHEYELEERCGVDMMALYEAAGATVLEKEYADIEVNGQVIRLGGIYGYCVPAKYLETNEANPEECAFLEEFQDTDLYTVLLCHMPVCWIKNGGLDEWDVDLILAGHVHGGQVILPLIGGLYGPDFGWFPGRLYGRYDSTDGSKTLILSRGLGSTEYVPRFGNVPEITVTDILPEN